MIYNLFKPIIISSTRENAEDQAIEKKIGEKLWGQKTLKSNHSDSVEPKNSKEVSVERNAEVKPPNDDSEGEQKIAEPEKSLTIESNTRIPEWLPEKQTNVGIVKVIKKLPHQRSKVRVWYSVHWLWSCNIFTRASKIQVDELVVNV